MRRGLLTAARLHQEEMQTGGHRYRAAMVTLTYRPDVDWQAKHVTGFIRCAREWLRRRRQTLRYVSVMETTKAGVPHYHVVLWLPRGLTLPKPDKRGWWPHGMTRIEWARKPIGYLAKYASKGDQGNIPRGARLHGCGGLSKTGRAERSWWLCPGWIREQWSVEHRPRRASGGGWMSRLTGEWMQSPWQLVSIGPGWSWLKFELREQVQHAG